MPKEYIYNRAFLSSQHNLTFINIYSKAEQKTILDTFYKFIVVRHPLDRLYSTFNGKFIHGGDPTKMYKNIGEKIKEKYGKRKAEDMSKPIKFSEYLLYASGTYGDVQNGHVIRVKSNIISWSNMKRLPLMQRKLSA